MCRIFGCGSQFLLIWKHDSNIFFFLFFYSSFGVKTYDYGQVFFLSENKVQSSRQNSEAIFPEGVEGHMEKKLDVNLSQKNKNQSKKCYELVMPRVKNLH